MLKDIRLNDAFEKAIANTIKSGDTILDIGCGTGLLSMMAVRHGAEHVYACEANPSLFSAARQIISDNGLEDKITLIKKHYSNLVVGVDIPERVDVIMTQAFSSLVIDEGMIWVVKNAKQALGKPDATFIPDKAVVSGRVLNSEYVEKFSVPIDTVNGFDLSHMERVDVSLRVWPSIDFHSCDNTYQTLSDDVDLYTLDLNSPQIDPHVQYYEAEFDITSSGITHGVELRMKLDFGDGVFYDVAPPEEGDWVGHWTPQLLSCGNAREVSSGDKIVLNYRTIPFAFSVVE